MASPPRASRFFSVEFLTALGIYFILQAFTFATGLAKDEFKDLWALEQMKIGHLPFRDFIFDYGPVGLFLLRGITVFTGIELYPIRIVIVAVGALCVFITYKIASRYLPPWPAAFVGLSSFGIATFPLYSNTHPFSVATFLLGLYSAMRYLESRHRRDLMLCAFWSVATILIRPLPTGVVLPVAFSFVLLWEKIRNVHEKSLQDFSLYLGSTLAGVLIFAAVYAQLGGFPYRRWQTINMGSAMTNGYLSIVVFRLPDPWGTVRGFWEDLHASPKPSLFSLGIKGFTMTNMLAGQLAYGLAIFLPAIYLFFSLFHGTRTGKVDSLKVLLAASAIGLGVYYHDAIAFCRYPDTDGLGMCWNWFAPFLLQPGLILGFILLYRGVTRFSSSKRFHGGAGFLIVALSLFLVVVPKLPQLRYLVVPMKTADCPGIRHIRLNRYYESAVMPAVNYLRENSNKLPSSVFSTDTEYQALAPQNAAFPEFYYIAGLADERVVQSGLFPGIANGSMTMGDFRVERLKTLKPVIVLNTPLKKLPYRWARFAHEHYSLLRQFTNVNGLTSQEKQSTVSIYVPREMMAHGGLGESRNVFEALRR